MGLGGENVSLCFSAMSSLVFVLTFFPLKDWDKPQHIPDPDAKKPDDWDDEIDGEWEPPMIDNPDYKVCVKSFVGRSFSKVSVNIAQSENLFKFLWICLLYMYLIL